MGYVAAEVTHNAEGVGEESLEVEVGPALDPAAAGGLIALGLATVEPHLVKAEDQLADVPFIHVLARPLCGRGEVVVEVAAEVDPLLGSQGDHIAGFVDVGREGLLAEDVLPSFEGLHDGLIVPTGVLVAASGHIHNIQVGLAVEHVGEAIVGLHAILLRGLIRSVLHYVADGDEIAEGFVCVRVSVGVADAAQAHYADLQSH